MDVAVYVTNGDPSPQPPVTKTVSITLLNKDTNAPTPWTEFVLVSNSSSNPMARFGMTDDQGIATFTDVPVGDYSLMAQFGRPLPSNYSPNQLTISLSETSESPLNFTIYETPSALESVTLKLTDKETGTPIVGAMFDYYYFDGQSYVKGNQDMGSFSTDSNGEIKFKDFIPEGQDPFMYPPDYLRGSKDTIYFVQVSAIEGYVKADGQLKVDTNNEVLVTNEKSVPVSASLKVVDAITGDIIPYDPANQDTWTGLKLYKKHISGTWLEVSAPEDYKPEGSANYYALYVPGPDGTTTILNLDSGQDYGYRVGKEPTLPISYRSETFEVTPIRLDAENLVKMYPSTYSATITVHIDDFDVNGLQKNIVGNKVELYDPLGVLIREYVIGEENYQSWGYRLQTQPLLPGVYTVVYDNGEERITKTVDTTVTDYAQVYIEVYPKPIEVNVNKMDAISKEPLAGAQFALYRWLPPTHISPMIARMATTTPMYTTILYDGKLWQLLDVYVTDVNGHFTAPITLPVLHDNGANLIPRYTTPEYLLVEIASPEGYVYDANAKIPIDPRKGSQVFDVENRPVKTDIYAEKNWSDGQDGKPGVSLQLSRSIANDAPEVLGTGIASADNNWQVVWKDMPIYDESGNEYGYTIKEVDIPAGYTASAPTGSGTLADPFVITNTSIVDTKPTPDPGTTTPGSPSTEPRYGIIKGEKLGLEIRQSIALKRLPFSSLTRLQKKWCKPRQVLKKKSGLIVLEMFYLRMKKEIELTMK